MIPVQFKLIAAAIVLVAVFACAWVVNGWRIGYKVAVQENARLQNVLDESARLKQKIRELDARSVKENEDAHRQIADLQRRIATGQLRLSVPGACAAGDPQHPGANPGEARAQLDPAVAADLVAITGDGDQAIRDLGVCQKILLELMP